MARSAPESLEGDQSVREAGDLATRLRDKLEVGPLTVETGRLSSIDAAGLQVLTAAHATARARGVSLRVMAPEGGALAQALARSGIAAASDLPLAWDGDAWIGFAPEETRP